MILYFKVFNNIILSNIIKFQTVQPENVSHTCIFSNSSF